MIIRTYHELMRYRTFEERFRYLALHGKVGEETFGSKRYLNQYLYQYCPEWDEVRDYCIVRDNGCDLAIPGRDITNTPVFIHHMNPITVEDIINRSKFVLDPEYLITTIKVTHDAIHYSDERILIQDPIERRPNDTIPWR